jgi:hypothetical protein
MTTSDIYGTFVGGYAVYLERNVQIVSGVLGTSKTGRVDIQTASTSNMYIGGLWRGHDMVTITAENLSTSALFHYCGKGLSSSPSLTMSGIVCACDAGLIFSSGEFGGSYFFNGLVIGGSSGFNFSGLAIKNNTCFGAASLFFGHEDCSNFTCDGNSVFHRNTLIGNGDASDFVFNASNSSSGNNVLFDGSFRFTINSAASSASSSVLKNCFLATVNGDIATPTPMSYVFYSCSDVVVNGNIYCLSEPTGTTVGGIVLYDCRNVTVNGDLHDCGDTALSGTQYCVVNGNIYNIGWKATHLYFPAQVLGWTSKYYAINDRNSVINGNVYYDGHLAPGYGYGRGPYPAFTGCSGTKINGDIYDITCSVLFHDSNEIFVQGDISGCGTSGLVAKSNICINGALGYRDGVSGPNADTFTSSGSGLEDYFTIKQICCGSNEYTIGNLGFFWGFWNYDHYIMVPLVSSMGTYPQEMFIENIGNVDVRHSRIAQAYTVESNSSVLRPSGADNSIKIKHGFIYEDSSYSDSRYGGWIRDASVHHPLRIPSSNMIENSVPAGTHRRTIYLYTEDALTLSAAECYLEARYVSSATNGMVISSAVSSDTLSAPSVWTPFTVEFTTPVLSNVQYSIYLDKYLYGKVFYIDSAIYDGFGEMMPFVWSYGEPSLSLQQTVIRPLYGIVGVPS